METKNKCENSEINDDKNSETPDYTKLEIDNIYSTSNKDNIKIKIAYYDTLKSLIKLLRITIVLSINLFYYIYIIIKSKCLII
jgi:hypothetical protein